MTIIVEIVLFVLLFVSLIGNLIWNKIYLKQGKNVEWLNYFNDMLFKDREKWRDKYYDLLSKKSNEDIYGFTNDEFIPIKSIGKSMFEAELIARDSIRTATGEHMIYKVNKFGYDFTKEELEIMLEEIKLAENCPLAYSIKNNIYDYIEIYINGKFKDKYTKEYAWSWAKSYATKYDWKQNNNVYELSDKKEESK
jgi:hypothetical protein